MNLTKIEDDVKQQKSYGTTGNNEKPTEEEKVRSPHGDMFKVYHVIHY